MSDSCYYGGDNKWIKRIVGIEVTEDNKKG